MISFGVIGSGVWGTKVIHAIRGLGFDVKVCNRHGEFEGQKCETDYIKLIPDVDIVWVATHPPDNFVIALHAIRNGIPTVVEKPVHFDALRVRQLVIESKDEKTPLIVDYIHLFNRALTEYIVGIQLRELDIRIGGQGPTREYSALWDYGSHAAAIALHFIRDPIVDIKISQSNITSPKREPGLYHAIVRFSTGKEVTMLVGNRFTNRTTQVTSTQFEFKDQPHDKPLQTLISKIAKLHLCGEYFTNGDLAVEVTDLLERLHKMLPNEP